MQDMRAIYLVRHGEPAFPGGRSFCLGRMDLPLSPAGLAQAGALGDYFRALPSARVVASPLRRCVQTARRIAEDCQISAGLVEVDMGLWTGLGFDEIRRRWPDRYALRGREPLVTAAPGGESLEACGVRALDALNALMRAQPGRDLVIVAHRGVNQMLYRALTGREPPGPQPYGGVTQLLLDGAEACPGKVGVCPEELPAAVPDEGTCRELLREFGTPEKVIAHCGAVAEMAMDLCGRLKPGGVELNEELVFAAALVHDLAKGQPHHARAGARWLAQRGYSALGAVVGSHMCLPEELAGTWSEKSLVFLADKLVRETGRVTLEERFFAHPAPEKLPYIRGRYEQAARLWDLLHRSGQALRIPS